MKRKGFTLVELLGVIILLGVVASIAIPVVSNNINGSKEKLYDKQVTELINAFKMYLARNQVEYNEHNNFSLTIVELRKTEFLEDKPVINPINNEEMLGCLYASKINAKISYSYSAKCVEPNTGV